MADKVAVSAENHQPPDQILPPLAPQSHEIKVYDIATPLDTSKLPHAKEDAQSAEQTLESVKPPVTKKFIPAVPYTEAPPTPPVKLPFWKKWANNLHVLRNGQEWTTVDTTVTPDAERAQFLQQVGFENADEVVAMWSKASKTVERGRDSAFSTPKMIEKNLKLMQQLELKRPGICRTLKDNFGIINYARYSEELLLNQYDNIDNVDADFGVVVVEGLDPEGVLSADSAAYTDLMNQANAVNNLVRVIEFNDVNDLDAKLKQLQDNYSSQINFAVLSSITKAQDGVHSIATSKAFKNNADVVVLNQDITADVLANISYVVPLHFEVPQADTLQVHLNVTKDEQGKVKLEAVPLKNIDYAASRGNIMAVQGSRVVPRNPDDVTINRDVLPKAA
ncbi:MAG: hypothetical protein ACEQSA_00130 [Weeksellaceae bacterium]